MTTWTIELPPGYSPDPHRTLFQCGANARLHRMARYRVTRAIRETTVVMARAAHLAPITVPVKILAIQHPAPGARTIDSENIAPLVKAMIDGLRNAGVLRNDSPAYVTETRNTVGARRPGSQLVLHLTEAVDDQPESEAA
jgi:hypothetical protein